MKTCNNCIHRAVCNDYGKMIDYLSDQVANVLCNHWLGSITIASSQTISMPEYLKLKDDPDFLYDHAIDKLGAEIGKTLVKNDMLTVHTKNDEPTNTAEIQARIHILQFEDRDLRDCSSCKECNL